MILGRGIDSQLKDVIRRPWGIYFFSDVTKSLIGFVLDQSCPSSKPKFGFVRLLYMEIIVDYTIKFCLVAIK